MKRLLMAGILSLVFLLPALGQVSADVQQGLIPFGAYERGNIDSVNLANGNVTIHIPVVSYPQRGGKLKLSYSLIANGKGWFVYKNGNYYNWRFQNNPGMQPASVPPWVIGLSGPGQYIDRYDQVLKVNDYNGDPYYLHMWNLTTADGAVHEIVPTNSVNGLVVHQGRTIDASGLYFDQETSTAYDSNGIRSGVNSSGKYMMDPNGNEITVGANGWTDTLGRVIPSSGVATSTTNCPTGTVSATSWTVPGYNGGTDTFKFCSANVAIQTNFNQPPVIESSGTATLLNAVVLPNLQKWQFSYDSYGNITSILFPTGGSITYTWTNQLMVSNGSRVVASRTFNANDGTGSHLTSYQWHVLIGGHYYNIVTDPAGNDTVNQPCNNSYICQTQYYAGSRSTGTLLKTVVNQYHSEGDPYAGYTQSLAVANVVLQSQTVTWPGGKTSQTATTYDAGFTYQIWDWTTDGTTTGNGYYGKPVLQTFSDYGPGQAGSILKKHSTAYQWQSDSNYLNENLLNLESTSKVLDGSGNTCAETDSAYDNASYLTGSGITMQHTAAPGSKRGNLSSITQQLTSTPCQAGASWRPITSYINAYDTGATYQTTDPLSHTTTFTYSSTFYGAYPTQAQLNNTTTPGSSTVVQHITGANYDFNTGLNTSVTDENGNLTALSYDNMWRLTQSSFPDGGLLTLSYQDSAPYGVTVTRKITASQNEITSATVDGVGRLSQTQFHDPDCAAGYVKQDYGYTEDSTAHDVLSKTSTPYCNSPGTIYGLLAVTHADLLNRTKSVVQTDGSTATTVYNDNQTTVTDEAGKQRKSQVDGLGQLTNVWEDPGTSPHLNYETDYNYNPLGNLTRVDQKGTSPGDSSNWRTRLFTYDSVSRLLTSSNPERGSITYTYNDDGTVATRTAPKPNQTSSSVLVTTTYSYDEIKRVTSISYSDGTTPTIRFIYDGSTTSLCTPPSLTPSNPKGNRTSMCDAAGGSAWSFDQMNRVLTDARKTNGVTKTTSYTYNANGSIATLTYPSGRVITYSYNNAAHPTSAVDVANSINYATNATYAPQGALASLQNGGSIVSTLYFNSRLQPCRISIKNSGTAPSSCSDATTGNILDFTYSFNLGAGDNGNVAKIANNRTPARTQNFTFDSFNRLSTAYTQATSGIYCWGEQYTYDSWTNLTNISGLSGYTGCTQESGLSVSANGQNQIQDTSNHYGYDAAGNTTADGVYAYSYNGENQLVSAGGVNYTYDGDGQRVQKSNGKLYWYGTGSDPLDESDASGTITSEYVFFGGARIARRDSSGNVTYYFADHLGSSRVVTNSTGTILDDSDFYPFGGERPYAFASGNTYKFERKERDTETGNDDFGARFYVSRTGRFLSVDWSSVPAPVPYANLTNPQTLNLYAFVADNPITFADLDGHSNTVGGEWQLISLSNRADLGNCAGVLGCSGPIAEVLLEDLTTNTTADVRAEQKQVEQQNAAQKQGEGSDSNLAVRKAISEGAINQIGSTAYNYADVGHDTCNQFVADRIQDGGASRPQTPTADGKIHDPSAGEWGTRDGSNGKTLIPQWRSLKPGETPQPGDVAAVKMTIGTATGHSGIVTQVKNGKVWVAASDSKRIEYNKFLGSGAPEIVYHRYVGD